MKDRGVQQNNVEFVLTVPAIWTDHSKQFMRVAAIEVNQCIVIFNYNMIMVYNMN